MKRKVIPVYEDKIRSVEYLKEKIAQEKSYSSLLMDLVGIGEKILNLFERRWSALSDYFEKITGNPVAMPCISVEILEDFLEDIFYLSENRKRPAGSDFFLLFGRELAKSAGVPERGEEIGRIVNALFWCLPAEEKQIFKSCGQEIFTDRYMGSWKKVLYGKKEEECVC